MHQNITFIATLLLFVLSSCGDTNHSITQQETAITIPQLLDRPEALWNDIEWDNVQSTYVRNQQKLQAKPEDGEASLKLAEVFINEARITGEHGHYYPAALRVLNAVLHSTEQTKDVQFRALSRKAGVLLSLHQFKEALPIAQQALALNPYNAPIHGVLVDAYVELGEYEKAIIMADRMVQIRPDLRSYSRISYLREIHGDIDGAVKAMQLAIQAGFPGNEQTAWARLTLGNLYQEYGMQKKARQQYQTILEERPEYPFAIAALADLEFQNNQLEAAEAKLKKAIEIIPEVGFYQQLAQLYKQEGQMDTFQATVDAIFPMLQDDVEHGHQMNMEYADLYLQLLDQPQKALEYALIEYNTRPNNIDVNRLLAKIYAKMDNMQKVREHLAAASSTQSKHPELANLRQYLAVK